MMPRRFPLWAWVVVLVLVVCQALVCFAARQKALQGNVDLRAFYAAGAILRSGHGGRMYDYDYQEAVQNAVVGPREGALPFLYPAFAALPFVPLSWLGYRAAFLVLMSVNLGLLGLVAALLRPWLAYVREQSWALLPAIFACLFGVAIALMQGQISFALLAIYSVTWILLERQKHFLAGMVMALALMKFQMAIPVAVLFLIWRRWRFVGGFATGGAVLAAISVAMVGRAGTVAYWHNMSGMTKQTALDAAVVRARYGMSLFEMPNVHGLTYGLAHNARWGLALNIVLCGAVLVFAARQKASLLVALPAAMLVSYHMQPHDLTLLLLPLSFVMDALLARQRAGSGDARMGMIAGLSVLLLVLPLAGVLMVQHLNYLVSFAVGGVMVAAAGLELSGVRPSMTAQPSA